MMEIKKAEFTLSAPMESMCPKDNKPEYAFIGRSNVGKSSLINMLTNNKKLAKTSATPGKTLLINHFIINNEWYLVDLPGYGFAKRSKKEVAKLEQMISGYILQREQLVNVFLLIDIRLEPHSSSGWVTAVCLSPSSSPRPISCLPPRRARVSRTIRRCFWRRGRNCRPSSSPRPRNARAATRCWTILNRLIKR